MGFSCCSLEADSSFHIEASLWYTVKECEINGGGLGIT